MKFIWKKVFTQNKYKRYELDFGKYTPVYGKIEWHFCGGYRVEVGIVNDEKSSIVVYNPSGTLNGVKKFAEKLLIEKILC